MNKLEARARADYEADLAKRPAYHDGTPRKPWEQLSEIAKWSWGRVPYVEVDKETAYGSTVRLSRSIRVF